MLSHSASKNAIKFLSGHSVVKRSLRTKYHSYKKFYRIENVWYAILHMYINFRENSVSGKGHPRSPRSSKVIQGHPRSPRSSKLPKVIKGQIRSFKVTKVIQGHPRSPRSKGWGVRTPHPAGSPGSSSDAS